MCFRPISSDCAALIARLDVESVDWVGTSMGALIGMLLAAQPGTPSASSWSTTPAPSSRRRGLTGIGAYLGTAATFESLEAMEAAVRTNNASFGPLTDAEWRKVTLAGARKLPDGRYGYNYDPHLGDPYKSGPVGDVDLWPIWDAVSCPVLVLRGEHSDVLQRDVAEAMTERGPKARLVEFAGIGHAPPLLAEDQIGVVRDFLAG